MAKLNVTQFAEELKLPVSLLLEQLQAAGVKKKAGEDAITEQDKTRLLDYLREVHGNTEKKKITLTRKQTTEIKKADATGKARTIQVEVRKKRTFVKVDKPAEVVPEPAKPTAPPAPIINAEEAKKREAEAKRQAELAARQAADAETRTKRAAAVKKKEEAAPAEAPAAPVEGEAPKKKRVIRKKGEDVATEAEAPVLVEVKAEAKAEPAKAEAKPSSGDAPEGTLHRPVLKPGEKEAKSDKKGAKRAAKPASAWVDDVARRRAIKTRGDASGGRDGWRSRGGGRHRDDDSGTSFAAPAEPKIIEVLVPETLTVVDLAHKRSEERRVGKECRSR